MRALIVLGRSQRTDFKAAKTDAADFARTSAALANSSGDTLLPGVSDDGG